MHITVILYALIYDNALIPFINNSVAGLCNARLEDGREKRLHG